MAWTLRINVRITQPPPELRDPVIIQRAAHSPDQTQLTGKGSYSTQHTPPKLSDLSSYSYCRSDGYRQDMCRCCQTGCVNSHRSVGTGVCACVCVRGCMPTLPHNGSQTRECGSSGGRNYCGTYQQQLQTITTLY